MNTIYNRADIEALQKSGGGGGGSTVAVNQLLPSGQAIAAITVDGVETTLYAPEGGGSSSSETLLGLLDAPSHSVSTQSASDDGHIVKGYAIVTLMSDFTAGTGSYLGAVSEKPAIPAAVCLPVTVLSGTAGTGGGVTYKSAYITMLASGAVMLTPISADLVTGDRILINFDYFIS